MTWLRSGRRLPRAPGLGAGPYFATAAVGAGWAVCGGVRRST